MQRAKIVSVPVVLSLLALAAVAVAQDAVPAPENVAAPPPEAERTESGLASLVLDPGTGSEHPQPESLVTVHYTGWTTDGEMFDSSVVRGKPVRLPLDSVIDGWTQGLQLMVEGETRRLWIPEELAYRGQEGRPRGMLVFDVELLGIDNSLVPPEHLAAPPPDATVTGSGLAYRVLQEGTGDATPTLDSIVTVHYTGWNSQRQVFESTALTGSPSSLPVNGVIKGWTEALLEMTQGEKRRLWIPEKLAYKGEEGKPQGMLIFDVELVQIAVTVQ